MMSQPEAAPELLNDMVCNCVAEYCHLESCPCLKNGQSCTAACLCEAALPGLVDLDEGSHVCMNPLTAVALFNVNEED